MVNIEWKGIEELSIVVKNAGSQTDEVLSAVLKSKTGDLSGYIQEAAPVDTATLKQSVRSTFPSKLESRTSSNVDYQGYQEYGTRFQPGKPHVRPSLKKIQPEFEKAMNDAIRKLLR